MLPCSIQTAELHSHDSYDSCDSHDSCDGHDSCDSHDSHDSCDSHDSHDSCDSQALVNPETYISIQKCCPYTRHLNSETSGESKNTFVHCGDALALFNPKRLL